MARPTDCVCIEDMLSLQGRSGEDSKASEIWIDIPKERQIHERDASIIFEEVSHKYYIVQSDGTRVEVPISVTGLIQKASIAPETERRFASISADEWISLYSIKTFTPDGKVVYTRMRKAQVLDIWKREEMFAAISDKSWKDRYSTKITAPDGTVIYRRWSKQQVFDSWDDKGAKASTLGTGLHAWMEQFLLGKPVAICRDEVRDPIYREKEAGVAWWHGEEAKGYSLAAAEHIMYHGKVVADGDTLVFDGVAGSIDATLWNKHTPGVIHLRDYKRCDTSKRWFDKAYRDKRLNPPFDALQACDHSKWRLQINVYRHILERTYNFQVGTMSMVVLFDGKYRDVVMDPLDVSSLMGDASIPRPIPQAPLPLQLLPSSTKRAPPTLTIQLGKRTRRTFIIKQAKP